MDARYGLAAILRDGASRLLRMRSEISFVAALAVVAATVLPAAAQDDAHIKQLTQAYNASGQQLFARFAATPGNIVFSPYSVGTAMAIALAGARGDTETEMTKVLQHHLGRADIDAANGALLKILNGYDHSATSPTCATGMSWTGNRCEGPPSADGRCPAMARKREGERCVGDPTNVPASAKLAAANALMLPGKGEQVGPGYRALVRDRYAADVFEGATLEDVNGWVSKKTEGKIPKILERLDPDAAAVLLNAVYFKAHWAATFSRSATREEAFSLTSSRKVQVPMMRQNGKFPVAARPGYRAIGLPYDVDELQMIVVLPNDVDGLAQVAGRLDADELAALIAAVAAEPARPVALELPRFKTSFRADLKAAFEALGMHEAFDDHRADFSGMTGRPVSQGPLKIGKIVHRSVIDVMEDGTEAAAATAVVMMPRSAAARPQPPEPFRVDHPFLFYIVDHATGAVLFAGRIVDPRERR
jgi:serpin B